MTEKEKELRIQRDLLIEEASEYQRKFSIIEKEINELTNEINKLKNKKVENDKH